VAGPRQGGGGRGGGPPRGFSFRSSRKRGWCLPGKGAKKRVHRLEEVRFGTGKNALKVGLKLIERRL